MNRIMNHIRLPLMAGGVLAACAGSAAAMSPGGLVDPGLVQDVRLVCHADGRCFDVHRRFYGEPGYRSYDWAPGYDYYGGPYYGGPSVGFSFGFGGGHHRW
jgi:hypothetical protein